MMRLNLLLTLFIAANATNLKDRKYYEEKFYDWLKNFNINIPSGENFVKYLQNFANNDDLIEQHNSGNSTFTLGHNQFSHLSREEWRDYVRLGLQRPNFQADSIHPAPESTANLADSVDWRTKGSVTGVKDQGQCGSCWAFSTTGALEGAHHIKYGELKSFSEQHLVECDNRKNGGTDLGCNGGLMDSAFTWIKKNGGIAVEADYPYTSSTGKSGTCDATKDAKKVAASTPKSFTDVQTNSDAALLSALNQQPVSVAIEADQAAFQLYKSGVFTAKCGTNLDHGVLAVGYGTESGNDYYLVKNSWGTSWGESGYIKLGRGSAYAKQGQCGILSGPPSYPNL